MFKNVGRKIQTLAKLFFLLGIIAGGIFALVSMVNISRFNAGMGVVVLLVFIIGVFIWWAFSLFLCGFGQLIENSDTLVRQNESRNQKEMKKVPANNVEVKTSSSKGKISQENQQRPKALTEDARKRMDFNCPVCGERLSFFETDLLENEFLNCPYCNSAFSTKEFRIPDDQTK